jgi:AcrR family transcriptional regulator
MAAKRARKLGRPPASSSVETRQRILDVARIAFAELGYGVTTNKYVATKAGITTGALYHYFDSKLDIYLAVNEHVQRFVYQRFREAIDANETFLAQFEAILQSAYDLNVEDPSLARFIGSARIDVARHDELREKLAVLPGEATAVLSKLVRNGLATGEILPEDRRLVAALIRTLFVGLVDAVSDDSEEHAAAIEGIRELLHGRLIQPPSAAPVSAAGRRSGSRRSTSSSARGA